MKRGHDLSGLMKYATSAAWTDHLGDALDDHLGPAMAEFDLGYEDLPEIVGDHWAGILWGCAFEDLLTRTIEPDARNLADDYLKRRGWNEAGPAKLYIRALRTSVMSLYEVSEVEPRAGFLARDLIRGGEPVRISERSASQTLKTWDRIAARVVALGSKHVLSGGVLSFNIEAADTLITALQDVPDKRRSRAKPVVDNETLRTLAPLISTAWLFDTIPRALGPTAPVLRNSDGEEVMFHRVRFPFLHGTTQALIGERLDAVSALQRENAQFWNWLGSKLGGGGKAPDRITSGVMMADGTPVLGTLELKGRALEFAVTSAERAARKCVDHRRSWGPRWHAPHRN